MTSDPTPRRMTAERFDEVRARRRMMRDAFAGERADLLDHIAAIEAERDRDALRGQVAALREKVGNRVLLAVESIEACTDCEETFTHAEQAAFDPTDNDHCPHCGARGTLTTYYGDPERRIQENDLGDPDEVFIDLADAEKAAAERDERVRAEALAKLDAPYYGGVLHHIESLERNLRETIVREQSLAEALATARAEGERAGWARCASSCTAVPCSMKRGETPYAPSPPRVVEDAIAPRHGLRTTSMTTAFRAAESRVVETSVEAWALRLAHEVAVDAQTFGLPSYLAPAALNTRLRQILARVGPPPVDRELLRETARAAAYALTDAEPATFDGSWDDTIDAVLAARVLGTASSPDEINEAQWDALMDLLANPPKAPEWLRRAVRRKPPPVDRELLREVARLAQVRGYSRVVPLPDADCDCIIDAVLKQRQT